MFKTIDGEDVFLDLTKIEMVKYLDEKRLQVLLCSGLTIALETEWDEFCNAVIRDKG
jgi:hypothetical protein